MTIPSGPATFAFNCNGASSAFASLISSHDNWGMVTGSVTRSGARLVRRIVVRPAVQLLLITA